MDWAHHKSRPLARNVLSAHPATIPCSRATPTQWSRNAATNPWNASPTSSGARGGDASSYSRARMPGIAAVIRAASTAASRCNAPGASRSSALSQPSGSASLSLNPLQIASAGPPSGSMMTACRCWRWRARTSAVPSVDQASITTCSTAG